MQLFIKLTGVWVRNHIRSHKDRQLVHEPDPQILAIGTILGE